jgi:hypothetical protein
MNDEDKLTADDLTDEQSEMENFTHEGLNCRIIRVELGHWCGYVQTPDDLGPVRWTADYDSKHKEMLEAEVDVWGGITYGRDADGWVGFDDAHATSLVEQREFDSSKAAVKNETKRLAEQVNAIQSGEKHPKVTQTDVQATYKVLEHLRDEVLENSAREVLNGAHSLVQEFEDEVVEGRPMTDPRVEIRMAGNMTPPPTPRMLDSAKGHGKAYDTRDRSSDREAVYHPTRWKVSEEDSDKVLLLVYDSEKIDWKCGIPLSSLAWYTAEHPEAGDA